MPSHRPIGILDSGFGGLSVARAIRARLPYERLLFAADCGFAPYGDRDESYILQRLECMIAFLMRHNAKAIVFACNTATAVGIRLFRERFSDALPLIGIEPAVFPAVRHTRSGAIGVMATSRTLSSTKYLTLKERAQEWADVHRPMSVRMIDVPCPGLMDCVERGDFDTPETDRLIEHYVAPLTAAGVDEIVLGCTHYPFLAKAIARHAPQAHLIDPAPAVAEQLERRLAFLGLLATPEESKAPTPEDAFFATGATPEREKVLQSLWPGMPSLQTLED